MYNDSLKDVMREIADRDYTPTLRRIINVGRNEQCFCGSGKKYKKCCMSKVESGYYQKYSEEI